jgi:hypothetical protein
VLRSWLGGDTLYVELVTAEAKVIEDDRTIDAENRAEIVQAIAIVKAAHANASKRKRG